MTQELLELAYAIIFTDEELSMLKAEEQAGE